MDDDSNLTRELLGRLDERTKAIQSSVDKMILDIRLQIDSTTKRIDDTDNKTNRRIDGVEMDLEGNYVTKKEFSPIQKIVYGLVAVILITFLGSLLTLVLVHSNVTIGHVNVG